MKNGFLRTLMGCGVLLMTVFSAKAQEGFNVTGGMGLPEMLNLGLRMQFEQTQLGFTIGTLPGSSDDIFAFSGDFYYHFGGSSEYTSLKPWFLKSGLTYMSTENEWERITNFLLVPRVGREFNISPKFGIALEAGFLVILSENEIVKKERAPSYFNFDFDFTGSFFPSAGLILFYRF